MNVLSHPFLRISQALARGRIALIGLGLMVVFLAGVLPWAQNAAPPAVREVSTPDLRLYYTADTLYQVAEALGPEGRAHYIRARFTLDVVWPLVYTLFFLSVLGWLAQRLPEASRLRHWVPVLPLIAVGFDLLENLAAVLVMARYPRPTPVVAELAGVFTLLKWLGVGACFLVGGIMAMQWGVRRLGGHKR